MPGGAVRDRPRAATASPSTTKRRAIAVLLQPYRIADRLVTCGEYAQFIADGGYERPALWLSDGWAAVQAQRLAGARLLDRARRPARARRRIGRCSACTACGRWTRPRR